jgi:hypothetical protein
VAAPVIAAGLAEAGVTGVAGTLATGGAVTAGGAGVGGVLRGGTSIVGQGIATGHVDLGKAWQETKEGAKHGAIDASTALVMAGTDRLLGKGTTVAGKVVRHAATGAAGGAFSSGVTAVSEGKSAGEVFESTGIGAVSGFAGGTVTSMLGGSAAQQSTARRVLSGAAGSVASGTTATVLSGGSTADIKRAVATSAITGVATSAATPTHGGPTTEEIPPKGKEPTHAASPEPGRASALPDPAEIFSAPKKIPSKLIPREKIELQRLKKLAVHAQVEEKAAAPAKEEESNVRSLDEFRQRKAAAAAAKKPQPPTEAPIQAQPVVLEQTAEAEMKLAAGAESQGIPVAGKSVVEESRLKIVASGGGGGGRSRPGGDLRHVGEFREREFGRNTPSLKTVRSGPSTLSEHLEELEATKSIRDLRKGWNRNLVDTEAQLHREIGKAIEPVEVEIFGGDLMAKGASSVHPNHEFPPWLQKIFPSGAKFTRSTVRGGPDLVAIDEKNGRIHVGDVTAKASGSHLAKTAAYARKIAAALPENYADFEVVAQERYYGTEQEYSDVVVVKPGTGKRSK